MRALVLGGTRFVGAAIVDELVRAGVEITIFSRGQTNPDMFPELEHVRGDRSTDLARLGQRRFDLVIDSSGYVPDVVELSAAMAAEQGAFYAFVSTGSVYDLKGLDVVDEDSPLRDLVPDHPLEAPENYGGNKALCEAVLGKVLGDSLVIVRPGLIIGPGDYTERFPYWAFRLATPGPVACPGDGDDPVQMIDVRDHAAFVARLALEKRSGIFNANGPTKRATFSDLVEQVAPDPSALEPIWVPSKELAARDISPWGDMPCWIPRETESGALLRTDLTRAHQAGLKTRPWSETANDTRAWLSESGRSLPFKTGLSAEREKALLTEFGR